METMRRVRKLLRPETGGGVLLYLECGHTLASNTHGAMPALEIFALSLSCATCGSQDASWERGRLDGVALARSHADVRTREAAKEIIRGAHKTLFPKEGLGVTRKRWTKGMYFGYWRTMVNENGVADVPYQGDQDFVPVGADGVRRARAAGQGPLA